MTNRLIHFVAALALTVILVASPAAYGQTNDSSKDAVDENFVVPIPGELEENTDENSKDKSNEPPETDPAADPAENDDNNTNEEDAARNQGPLPVVQRDLTKLPEPVHRMRELILQAAMSGEIEKLRDLVGIGESATTLSIGGLEGDPIAFLKEASGDDEGIEILAILAEILEAGYVHLDAGEDDELYVWPYFFAWPMEKLLPPMKVELFRVLTAGDVEDSRNFGGYVFYRVGIKPDGTWSFFVAGD